jgi:hypothetical protein
MATPSPQPTDNDRQPRRALRLTAPDLASDEGSTSKKSPTLDRTLRRASPPFCESWLGVIRS